MPRGHSEFVGPKIYPATVDAYGSYISVSQPGESEMHHFVDILPSAGTYYLDRIIATLPVSPGDFDIRLPTDRHFDGLIYDHLATVQHTNIRIDNLGRPSIYMYYIASFTGPEFRCAR